MQTLKFSNLILAFLLELMALLILSYWGFVYTPLPFMIGIGATILFIVIWAKWCAPKATHRLEGNALLCLKSLLLSIPVLCLVLLNQLFFALIFALLILLHLSLSSYFKTV